MRRRYDGQKFIDRARGIIENGKTNDEIVNRLRGSNEAMEVLHSEGWLPKNTGVNVQGLRYWKKQREEAVDKHYFDFLLRDIIHAQVKFWQHYHGYDSEEEFLEDAIEGKSQGWDSEENMAKTFIWLRDEIEAPTELESRQEGVEVFV